MSKHNHSGLARRFLALWLGAGMMALATQADAQTGDAIEAHYRLEVERCHQGNSTQDMGTCLREAAAARDAMRNNTLTDNSAAFEKNRLLRCQSLPAERREDCIKQMEGSHTKVMGNFESGGVLRETTIIVPAPVIAPPTYPAPGSDNVQTMPVPE